MYDLSAERYVTKSTFIFSYVYIMLVVGCICWLPGWCFILGCCLWSDWTEICESIILVRMYFVFTSIIDKLEIAVYMWCVALKDILWCHQLLFHSHSMWWIYGVNSCDIGYLRKQLTSHNLQLLLCLLIEQNISCSMVSLAFTYFILDEHLKKLEPEIIIHKKTSPTDWMLIHQENNWNSDLEFNVFT